MKSISEQLKIARKDKKWSQAKLAQYVGSIQAHISKIEKGDVDLRLSSLQEIARILGLEVMLVPAPLQAHLQSIINGEEPSQKPRFAIDGGEFDE